MKMRAHAPIAVIDVDLTDSAIERHVDPQYRHAWVLVRLHNRPIGSVCVPVTHGQLHRATLLEALLAQYGGQLAVPLARLAMGRGDVAADFGLSRLFDATAAASLAPPSPITPPVVTVAVCTRDRPDDLARCLDSIQRLDYPHLDVLVVDNAPRTEATRALVRTRYPRVRYVREARPGLDWARNRAVQEARGEILAFTDDDVCVDRLWVRALTAIFAADDSVMLVTGLVIPDELETEAQTLFEAYGGFGRGFERRWFHGRSGRPGALEFGGAGAFGTGANMAYRRSIFERIGGFDPALDVGTCTNGGGDLEMFFRVLKEGHTLVYEPAALVRHRHRREYPQLRAQIANNGIGFYSYLVRSFGEYPDERRAILRLGAWWFGWWNLRRLARAIAGGESVPLDLVVVELVGSVRGLFRYRRARAAAAGVAQAHGSALPAGPPHRPRPRLEREAVWQVDAARPLAAISGLEPYRRVHLFVSWRGTLIGKVAIDHDGCDISNLQLEDAIAGRLSAHILDVHRRDGVDSFWQIFLRRLRATLAGEAADADAGAMAAALSSEVPVSVVVATRDRPADLRACLDSLARQRTRRRLELIVVDNNPASGTTPSVVRQFHNVVLLSEPRAGLSYARNRGFLAATSPIVASTDDDVVCPPEWVDTLVSAFQSAAVMAVTGNVLPARLETRAQQLFEMYGGLGRGYSRVLADAAWFRRWRRSVPTWELGCTANAAFRASIFADPRIGLLDEALGAGTPTGCSEDTYLFYRVLKAGYSIAYEPRAYVWHRHRETDAALRQQIFSYSKGHAAYQLCTLLEEGDRRALVRLGYELPLLYARRFLRWLLRRSDYPLRLLLLEIGGTLLGPWALWRSRRRVRRLGRSSKAEPSNDLATDRGTRVREDPCSTH